MTSAVSRERWADAQAAESMYWEALAGSPAEFTRILAEKAAFAAWVAERLGGLPPSGDWLELGIGPLGVGCLHVLDVRAEHTLVGVDPLAMLKHDELTMAPPFEAFVRACRSERYTQAQATGEETGLEAGRFGLVATYNVLDHVRHPRAVLRESHRLLRPGGILVLGCDTVSWAGLIRHRVYGRRRFAATLGGRAHPFRFRAKELLSLVEDAGFRLRAHTLRGPLVRLLGRVDRLYLIAEHVDDDDSRRP